MSYKGPTQETSIVLVANLKRTAVGSSLFIIFLFLAFTSASAISWLDSSTYFEFPTTIDGWIFRELGPRLYFGGSAPSHLVAQHEGSTEMVEIVSGMVGEIQNISLEQNIIYITVPNKMLIDEVSSHLAQFEVRLRYVPRDDPAERNSYRDYVLSTARRR